eukprot:scaffold218466_cov36-Prasinocladus_malaysianus.AAC.2
MRSSERSTGPDSEAKASVSSAHHSSPAGKDSLPATDSAAEPSPAETEPNRPPGKRSSRGGSSAATPKQDTPEAQHMPRSSRRSECNLRITRIVKLSPDETEPN